MGIEPFFFGTEPLVWLQETVGLGYPFPFRVFSLLGDTWGILLAAGVAFWLFGRRALYSTIWIIGLGAATKMMMTAAFDVSRPSGPNLRVYEELDIGSFPSGHVYQGAAPWMWLYASGRLALWVPALMAVLIALGRLYLGVHYVGDVLGGIVFAIALTWLFARLWPYLRRLLARPRFRTYALAAGGLALGALAYAVFSDLRPRRAEIAGIALGTFLALPAEYRWVGYRPHPSPTRRLVLVLAGLAGLVGLVVLDRLVVGESAAGGVLVGAAAAVWVIAVAPALAQRSARSRGGASEIRARSR